MFLPQDLEKKTIDLDRLSTAAIDIYMMICNLSRANHAMCYGRRNHDMDKQICAAICKSTFLKHLQLYEDLSRETDSSNDQFVESIFKANAQSNGYFADLFNE